MSAHAQPRLTEEEYLHLERAADFKHEYFDGRMWAMAGASFNHGRTIGNLVLELGIPLKQRPCSVIPNDLRLRVAPGGLYTYPDVIVVCGEPMFADGHNDTLLNPVFLAEVLSPSTERCDRGFKSSQYRTIASLKEYALVSQDEPRTEVYARQTSGGWVLSEASGLESAFHLTSLDCRIALADVYAKVTFPEREIPH